MSDPAIVAFWLGVAFVAYVYLGYPALVWLASRLRPEPHWSADANFRPLVSVVVAVRDEQDRVAERVSELLQQLEQARLEGEVVVVSDGSTDATVERARAVTSPAVRVLELPAHEGKACAVTLGCARARGEVLVLADARQRWAPGALAALVRPFVDPQVGGVTGELVLESGTTTAGVGLYWRFEKWLRRTEARLHSSVGATGAICAVRRADFAPIPAGTLLDDVYWPLRVVMNGRRVVYAADAIAFDVLPPARDEFRRKVRTLAGNFQLVALLPQLLLPWRNPLWLQFVSHKLLRLLVPWALLVVLVSSRLADALFYQLAFVGQVFFYAAAALGMAGGTLSRFRLTSTPGSFVLLNLAAVVGLWVWATGNSRGVWRKAHNLGRPGQGL